MNADLTRRALALYADAFDLPLEEREAFVRQRAGEDDELRAFALGLLSAGEDPPARLEARLGKPGGEFSLLAVLSLEGQRLGDFLLLKEIGRGAVGTVYIAEQRSLRRKVAVKVLDLAHVRNEDLVRRFKREPQLQARFAHPHIVKAISSGCEGGWHFFGMEFVEGASLAQIIEAHAQPGGRATSAGRLLDLDSELACARVVEKVARALHHAHEHGVVHRDIKPQNILIDAHGEPFVSDFGLAKDIDQTAILDSMSGALRGTIPYMSPEQAREFHGVDRRSDVYSLGAVLYQMFTRRLPLDAETGCQLLQKLASRDLHVEPPHKHRPDLDLALSRICIRALEKDIEQRYPTALAMAEQLLAHVEGRAVEAGPSFRYVQLGTRRIARRTILASIGGAATLVGGAVLAWPRRPRARLRLELPPGMDAARVRLARILPPTSELDRAEERGWLRNAGVLDGIEPGTYRIEVVREDGAFSELQRTIGRGQEVSARAYPSLVGKDGDSMALVPAATVRVACSELGGERSFSCSSFWIDRGAVTNREFREFLQTTGHWPSASWTQRWLDVWNGGGNLDRPRNWDDLPVVNVTWQQARDYAEWKGKRLATIGEWWLALGLEASPRLTPEIWREIVSRFVVGKPEMEPWDGHDSTLAAYLKYVQPARLDEARAYGPHHLWHPFGNVSQWLASGPFVKDDAEEWTLSVNRHLARSAWHMEVPRPGQPDGAELISEAQETDASGDLGFRCVKSAVI